MGAFYTVPRRLARAKARLAGYPPAPLGARLSTPHLLLAVLPLTLSCATAPAGLRLTPEGSGPVVTVDWDAKPLANIPFPNDLATRADPTSITGLRVNIPLEAATDQEAETRAKINQLVGFGIYAPITVAFEAPLDLDNLAARHRDDRHGGFAQFTDDAIFVIDVDPDSPSYLQPAELDIGQGRFPMDVPNPDRYFPNDSRATCPSLVFDTIEEDVNGDGEMSWGEDLDNDGILDAPNVYPDGGDPRADLLTWYEKQTNTLILRPVVPLREEGRYAVVITERMTGADGAPVRSPWEYVNHLRQTDALRPVEDALPALGLSVEDVAFAWVFSTGRVTGDLVDVHLGLHGEGRYSTLGTEYPAGVTEGHRLHDLPEEPEGNPSYYRLPIPLLMDELVSLGLFEGESADVLVANYKEFADVVVGGTFETPYLLADRDDGGAWDADEWWLTDPVQGTYAAAAQRVTFTCVLPKERPAADGLAAVEAPFPVVLFGHGYGSSRFDFLGFAWAFNRLGMAACAADFPGHGIDLSDEDLTVIRGYLGVAGVAPFLDHLLDGRQRDLDNDGLANSGGDQWTADAFHTADMVRQAAVDWMQMVHSLQACGDGEMTLSDGGSVMSCDWDDDGAPDVGGPDVPYYIVGGSLGGINAGVAAAVIPEVEAWAPIVPGGGLLDVAVRTEISGAVEAMSGRLMTPMLLGYPTGDGGLSIVQLVNSVTEMVEVPIATLPSFPAGGKLVVENLDKGTSREGYIPTDGTFRVSIAADGLDAFERQSYVGVDNEGLGDRLVLHFYDAAGAEVATIDKFEAEVTHEGTPMAAGSTLVAASHGSGYIRGTPELRRVAMAFGMLLEPGDAISYAPRYALDPIPELASIGGGVPVPVLLVPTPGDSIVSINSGIALARAAGAIDRETVDPRWGMTQDQFLIDRGVVSGLEEFGPYTDVNGASCLFDADDFDDGGDGTGAPSDAPARFQIERDGSVVALRLPYANRTGTHGFGLPEPSLAFDINTFAILQIATFFQDSGAFVSDDPCLATATCDWIPAVSE